MNIPKVLNGYEVIQSAKHTNCATVMMTGDEKVVVATWWPELKSTWSWGHYFHGERMVSEAVVSFAEVSQRNARR